MSLATVVSPILVVVMTLSAPASVLAQAQESQASGPAAPANPEPKLTLADLPYVAGAVVATAANVPLRTGLCALGVAAGLVVFIASIGTGYRYGARAVEESCGGPWIITPTLLRGDQPAKSDSDY